MKVIYERSVLTRILEEVHIANRKNKEIEKIILTKDEAYQLKNELLRMEVFTRPGTAEWDVMAQRIDGIIYGVIVETES